MNVIYHIILFVLMVNVNINKKEDKNMRKIENEELAYIVLYVLVGAFVLGNLIGFTRVLF